MSAFIIFDPKTVSESKTNGVCYIQLGVDKSNKRVFRVIADSLGYKLEIFEKKVKKCLKNPPSQKSISPPKNTTRAISRVLKTLFENFIFFVQGSLFSS